MPPLTAPLRFPRFWQLTSAFVLLLGVSAWAQPERFEKEIAAFEQADRTAGSQPVDVLFYGSSSFRLWKGIDSDFASLKVLNRGFGGSQLSDLIHFFDRVVPAHNPRVLLIYGGDNDLAAGKTPGQVLTDFETLVGIVRQKLPRTTIAFVAVKPSPQREKLLALQHEANARVREFARAQSNVDFIDAATPLLDASGRPDPKYFEDDKLHLNRAGYDVWKRVIAPYLERHAAGESRNRENR